jgi:hypothetical protein
VLMFAQIRLLFEVDQMTRFWRMQEPSGSLQDLGVHGLQIDGCIGKLVDFLSVFECDFLVRLLFEQNLNDFGFQGFGYQVLHPIVFICVLSHVFSLF